jgi:hypothetical protein
MFSFLAGGLGNGKFCYPFTDFKQTERQGQPRQRGFLWIRRPELSAFKNTPVRLAHSVAPALFHARFPQFSAHEVSTAIFLSDFRTLKTPAFMPEMKAHG